MEVLLSFPGSKIPPMIQAQLVTLARTPLEQREFPFWPTAESASHHFFQESLLKELCCASESPSGSSRLQNREGETPPCLNSRALKNAHLKNAVKLPVSEGFQIIVYGILDSQEIG